MPTLRWIALALSVAVVAPAQETTKKGTESRASLVADVARLRSIDPEEREAAIPIVIGHGAAALEALDRLVFELALRDDQTALLRTTLPFRRDVRIDALRVPPEALLPHDRFASGDDAAQSEYDAVEDREAEPQQADIDAVTAISACLRGLGAPALPLLGKMLHDPARAHAAAGVLGHLGIAALPLAREALTDPLPIVRGEGCRILGLLAASSQDQVVPDEALAALVAGLGNPDPRVHKRAAWALLRIGARAVPLLERELDSDDAERVARATGTLALFGPDAARAAPRLLALATGKNGVSGRTRQWACDALGRLQPDPAFTALVVEALSQELDSQSTAQSLTAAEALGRLGPSAGVAVARLVACLHSKSEDLRLVATLALGKIGGPAACVAIVQRLDDPAARVRRGATVALVEFGASVLTVLVDHLDGRDPQTLDLLAEALVAIGDPAVAPLAARAKAGSVHARRAATLALGKLGGTNPTALATLDELLQAEGDPMRLVAIEALGSLVAREPANPNAAGQALHRLLPLLRDESPYVRITAAHSIGQLRTSARAGVPQLMDALGDEIIDVQIAAVEALAAIGPDARAALTILRQLAIDAPGPLQAAARSATRCIGANPSPRPR